MAHDIFISYSHKDKAIADAICSHLESNGMRCWYAPRDIAPGTEWGVEILKGIEAAKIMVLVFTKDANLSQQVLREVNNAVNAGLSIIPFRLTEEEPAAGMKYYLSTVHWMDAMNEELASSIEKLGNLCKAILEKKPVPETAVKTYSEAYKHSSESTVPAQAQKNRSVILIAAIAALAVIGLIAVVLLRGRGNQKTEADNNAGSQVTVVESAAVSETDNGESANVEGAGNGSPDTDTGKSSESTAPISIAHEGNANEVFDLGATTEGISTDLGETYTLGNNQSNIQNGGYLAYDGEWYYYISNDGEKLYRMKEDGSEATKLTDTAVKYISVLDGYIYFLDEDAGIQRMKTDGTDLTTLNDSGYLVIDTDDVYFSADCETMRIVGDRIYFPYSGLASMALDGTDPQFHNDIWGYDTVLDGTWQYYIDPDFSKHLFRAKLDGSEAACIYDQSVGNLRIAGNYLFFYDYDDGYFKSYDLSTGEVLQLTPDPANCAVITKDGVYAASGNLQLEFIPLTSIGVKKLTQEWVDKINVAGNKIFYYNQDDYAYYIMNLDGTGKMKT